MDRVSSAQRSEVMRRVRSKNTKPEMLVRRLAHGLGYRFRLHRAGLAGSPDIVFPGRRKVIFVHGCFWHQHADPSCKLTKVPKSRQEYWIPKLERNVARDARSLSALKEGGWDALVLWECQLADAATLASTLIGFLGPPGGGHASDRR